MKIKVSIIVPIYNASNTIERCAESLLHQTMEEIEILFVDDCSGDDSYVFLQQLQKFYHPKVKLFRTEKNLGPGGARNLGIKNAKGEYIGFVDSDDVAELTMYEMMYQKAKETDATIVDCAFADEEMQRMVCSIPPGCTGILDNERRNRLISAEGYVWNKIYKRSFLEQHKILFREGVIMEDTDFILYTFALAERLEYLEEVLYRHICNKKSLMHTAAAEQILEQSKKVMVAISDRMASLPQYEQLREGTDAFLISLYLNAIINICVREEMADPDKLKNLAELREIKQKIITGGYENPYLIAGIDENCKEIMRMNETCPEKLLHLLH